MKAIGEELDQPNDLGWAKRVQPSLLFIGFCYVTSCPAYDKKAEYKGAKDLSGQGWWPIVETGGADGAGLEEVHGRASPSSCCCCSSITLPLEEMAHDVVAVGKEGSCWMRCRWSWWSGLLVGN
ncbi:hypothetical protein OIU76_024221 [Salix suchowensis]|nr:hypothetical protein OIU76_024221 [Salix suchowensis]